MTESRTKHRNIKELMRKETRKIYNGGKVEIVVDEKQKVRGKNEDEEEEEEGR